MENIVLSLIVNGMMAILLLVTISYCGRLNRRIQVLQDSKSELARIIREFDVSVQQATDSIAEIHAATSRLSENIQHKIDKANFLADDLQYMIEKGSKLMGKAEPAMPHARPTPSGSPTAARTGTGGGGGMEALRSAGVAARTPLAEPVAEEEGGRRGGRVRSRAEQDLRQALTAKDNTSR